MSGEPVSSSPSAAAAGGLDRARLSWERTGRPHSYRSTYRNVVGFRIERQGSLPSMIRWVLFEGDEHAGSRRTLRDAKALAEARLAQILAEIDVELHRINRDLYGPNHVVDPAIRRDLGRRRRELRDALAEA